MNIHQASLVIVMPPEAAGASRGGVLRALEESQSPVIMQALEQSQAPLVVPAVEREEAPKRITRPRAS